MKKGSFFLLCLLIIVSCTESKEVSKSARSVKVTKVLSLNENQNTISLPATINERRGVNLAFRVGGPLVSLNNITGSYVQKGEVIAGIDKRDFKVALSKTESNYKLAKAEYERYKELLSQESVSKSVFDQMEARYIMAKGNYDDAKNAFADTELRAPYSGYIDRVMVENFEKVNPGQPIVSFLDLSSYKVTAWISVEDAKKINDDAKFVCQIKGADSTYCLNAKLLELGSKASNSKQSYPISVVVEAPQNGTKLRAGMSAILKVTAQTGEEAQACVIPVTSVFASNEQMFVWVYNNQQVTKREVELGAILSDNEVTVERGLTANDVIVSAGVNYLHEGEQVKVYQGFSKTNKGNQL